MSRRVTPVISAAAGSASQGTAMSMISSGRGAARSAMARVMSACSRISACAPVDVRTTSTAARWSVSSNRSMARPRDLGGQRLGWRRRPVGHQHVAGPGPGQGDGHALAHLAGPDHQHPHAVEPAQPLRRHGDGGPARPT